MYDLLIEFTPKGGVFDESGGDAAHHVRALHIGGDALPGGLQRVAHQIGGGGLAVGAGDEDDLIVVDPLEVTDEIRHQAGGDHAGVVAAAAAVDEIDGNGHQLGQPEGEDEFHSARCAPSWVDSA